MPAQKHAEQEICDFNAKTREFTLYDRRKTKALLSLLISDQKRLKQACVDKIREICEFGARTKQFIYYMANQKKIADKPADFRSSRTRTSRHSCKPSQRRAFGLKSIGAEQPVKYSTAFCVRP